MDQDTLGYVRYLLNIVKELSAEKAALEADLVEIRGTVMQSAAFAYERRITLLSRDIAVYKHSAVKAWERHRRQAMLAGTDSHDGAPRVGPQSSPG